MDEAPEFSRWTADRGLHGIPHGPARLPFYCTGAEDSQGLFIFIPDMREVLTKN